MNTNCKAENDGVQHWHKPRSALLFGLKADELGEVSFNNLQIYTRCHTFCHCVGEHRLRIQTRWRWQLQVSNRYAQREHHGSLQYHCWDPIQNIMDARCDIRFRTTHGNPHMPIGILTLRNTSRMYKLDTLKIPRGWVKTMSDYAKRMARQKWIQGKRQHLSEQSQLLPMVLTAQRNSTHAFSPTLHLDGWWSMCRPSFPWNVQ